MSRWGDQMRGKVNQLSFQRSVFLAATGTMAQMSERIWGRGGLTDGGTIQYDEDYEVWAYKPPAPRAVSGKGKPNAKGESRSIKGGYYATYLAFKEGQGRAQTPFDLTSALRQDWLGGATPTPRELSPLIVAIELSEVNAKKAEGLAEKKGAFLLLNEQEKHDHHKRLEDGWSNILAA